MTPLPTWPTPPGDEYLYHTNFGPPLLGAGAEFVAPVKKVAPRDARAAEGSMEGWNTYTGPHQPGYSEQVYLMELSGDENGMTEALLKSPDGSQGALLSFSLHELPFMTLWKNEAPSKPVMLPDWSPLPVFLTRGRWKEQPAECRS